MKQAVHHAMASTEQLGPDRPRISFLGPPGTFSESVVDYIFEDLDFKRLPHSTISECVNALTAGEADHAVVPVENSTGGVVPDFWDILAGRWEQRNWRLTQDVVSRVSQHLFTTQPLVESREPPAKIFSHWQALRQCRKYLDRVYPEADRVPVDSTAEAGRLVRDSPQEPYAAIGHRNIGERFNLDRLATSVEDNPFNQTRFVLLSRIGTTSPLNLGRSGEARALTYHSAESSSLTSVPSALAEIEDTYGWQLTGCYSLPKPGYMGEYNVFMDWRTRHDDGATAPLRSTTRSYVVLDTYQRIS